MPISQRNSHQQPQSVVSPWRFAKQLLIILSIAAICLFGLATSIDYQRQQALAEAKQLASEQLSVVRSRLERRIQANILVLRALRAEIGLKNQLDSQRLTRMMDEFLGSDLDITHIAIAPDLKIAYVYPENGNIDALGLDYRTVPSQLSSVQAALTSGTIVVTGPVDLVQGGQGIIARMPIFNEDGSDWGVVSLAINPDSLFNGINFNQDPDYDFALRRSSDQFLIKGEPQVFQVDALLTSIGAPTESWQLALYPRNQTWLSSPQPFFYQWLVGIAIISLIVLAYLALLSSQYRLRRALHTIAFQAHYDELTELPNRQAFQEKITQTLSKARATKTHFAILLLDIDRLREINDALGHDAGDQLLIEVARRIQAAVPPGSTVARIGGDGFAVLLAAVGSGQKAEKFAKAIISRLLSTIILRGDSQVNITATVGVTLYQQQNDEQVLLREAEIALYEAKRRGSLSICVFDEVMRKYSEQHIILHHEMLEGLKNGQFSVHYQPVLDTESKQFSHCEALIRWYHPERKWIAPREFIGIAEQTGAIVEIGQFVFEQILRDWVILQQAGFELNIAMNRSVREFVDRDVAASWLAKLDNAHMPHHALIIEITESMLMDRNQRQVQHLEMLRKNGVKIAIDDFGTGYSSLNYLRTYPVDIIKIDRSFLTNVPVDDTQTSLVNGFLDIARSLGLTVIAEGVETAAQADYLATKGCHYQQGFLYARPMPLSDLLEFLRGEEKGS